MCWLCFTLEHSLATLAMGYSGKCHNLTTYWDRATLKCVPCPVKPGHEVTPNCGKNDFGGFHDVDFRKCNDTFTFNDGSSAYCRPCTLCPPGYNITNPCTITSDTQCQEPRSDTTTRRASTTVPTTSQHVSTFFSQSPKIPTTRDASGPLVLLPLVILIITILFVIAACVLYIKRKKVFHRGHRTVLGYSRRSSYINAGFSSLSSPHGNKDLEDILGPSILSAPLQTVLDDLDVLEELVILLDPESQGVKNTKHLASHWSFPAPWVTYTYSMKESKSPLKAVLEGVTSRQPDWTVGHMAKLLRQMERNDAIAVLSKLKLNVIQQV